MIDKDQGLRHLRALAKRINRTRGDLDKLYTERRRWFVMLRGVASNVEIAKASGVSDVIVIKERNRLPDEEAS